MVRCNCYPGPVLSPFPNEAKFIHLTGRRFFEGVTRWRIQRQTDSRIKILILTHRTRWRRIWFDQAAASFCSDEKSTAADDAAFLRNCVRVFQEWSTLLLHLYVFLRLPQVESIHQLSEYSALFSLILLSNSSNWICSHFWTCKVRSLTTDHTRNPSSVLRWWCWSLPEPSNALPPIPSCRTSSHGHSKPISRF